MRRLRILVLMHPDFVPPDSADGYTARQINEWKTEYDVASTLRAAGHEVRPLGVQEEIKPVRDELGGCGVNNWRGLSSPRRAL
jgi:D-alanine-D-alanine ligase